MGNADDHVHGFVRLDLCHGGLYRLYRVLEFQFTGGRAGEGILAENAHHGNAHIALLHHGVVLHAVGGKGVFEHLLSLSEAGGFHGVPVYIADYDGRDGIAGGAGAGKHIGKPLGAVIELVVAKGGHIVAHVAQHPQLCSLRFKHRLDQGAHGKVTAVDHKGVRVFGALRLDEGVDAGKAADVRLLILHHGGKGIQVGVGVVAEQDVQRFARLRCLPIGGGNAQQHRKQQQHGHRHGEKLFHGVFSFVASLFFFGSAEFLQHRKKVIPLYKNKLSARYFSINVQNKQDGSCLFAPICNAFYKKDAVPPQPPADELPLAQDDFEWPPLALWPCSAEKIF